MDTFQFADIIILALIAGFIALRLRNTLGKDVGHRPDSSQLRAQMGKELEERVVSLASAQKAALEKNKEEAKDKAYEALTDALQKKVDSIKKHDPEFSLTEFVEGAKGAFEWVVKAFNDGEKSTLKQLLSSEVYAEFEDAMVDRLSSQAQAHTTLVAINDVHVVDAEIKKQSSRITLRFESEQIHVVKNESEEIISGDASEVIHVEDEWVFERSLKSRDPNWTIIDT